ncbi:MAG TPA: HEPN domain-containing protein [Spirochaetota bacterium]|nr:HEPN domain-containing protein [Spirochaetota bacterium]HQO39018.1 HEPN domain-containing protein [Spirochaetota bacterium]
MDDKTRYWIDISAYDYETAKSMLEAGRYLYVGFMCHQAIEKILKAYWQKTREQVPPRTHNLLYLVTETGLKSLLSESQLDFIDELDPLNVASRYPEHAASLSERFNRQDSELVYVKTGELFQWIKQKLS